MTNEIKIFIPLLLVHLLADYVLQTKRDVLKKKEMQAGTHLRHALTHAVLSALVLLDFRLYYAPIVILVTHLAIDLIKERVARTFKANQEPYADYRPLLLFIADQALHIAVLYALVLLMKYDTFGHHFWQRFENTEYLRACIWISGFIFTVFTGGVVIGLATDSFRSELEKVRLADGPDSRKAGFISGGATIGKAERILIFILAVSGNMAGIGFLIAAKSVFRFPEIKANRDRMEAEYVIIGTMYSFAWAIAASYLTQWIIWQIY